MAIDHFNLEEAKKKLNSVKQTYGVQWVKKALGDISEILHGKKDSKLGIHFPPAETPLKDVLRFRGGDSYLLWEVIRNNHIEALRLVAREVPIHGVLMKAMYTCNPGVMQQLLEFGADPSGPEVKNLELLTYCADWQLSELRKMLQEARSQKPKV